MSRGLWLRLSRLERPARPATEAEAARWIAWGANSADIASRGLSAIVRDVLDAVAGQGRPRPRS